MKVYCFKFWFSLVYPSLLAYFPHYFSTSIPLERVLALTREIFLGNVQMLSVGQYTWSGFDWGVTLSQVSSGLNQNVTCCLSLNRQAGRQYSRQADRQTHGHWDRKVINKSLLKHRSGETTPISVLLSLTPQSPQCFNPQIYTRDSRPPIPPHEMASSVMGLNLGVFRFLPTTHPKVNVQQMRSRSLCAIQHVALVCLHARIAVHAGNIHVSTWRTAVILITGKSRRTSKSARMPGSRWCRFRDLWCISAF